MPDLLSPLSRPPWCGSRLCFAWSRRLWSGWSFQSQLLRVLFQLQGCDVSVDSWFDKVKLMDRQSGASKDLLDGLLSEFASS